MRWCGRRRRGGGRCRRRGRIRTAARPPGPAHGASRPDPSGRATLGGIPIPRPTRDTLSHRAALVACTLLGASAAPAAAQPPRQFTAADYDRAVRMLGPNLNPLVIGGSVTASWLAGGRLWYSHPPPPGQQIV